jgi:hypothetical protein
MIVEQDVPALQRWIEDAAAGNVSLQRGESTPWTTFYAEYRDASTAVRARVDDAFRALRTSMDVDVRYAVVSHWFEAEHTTGFTELRRLLTENAALYDAQEVVGSSQTLRARLLGGLAAQANGDAARDLLLRHVHDVAVVPPRVGIYLGRLGADTTEALVRLRPDVGATRAVKEAGYELHRDSAVWADVMARSANWPAPLRDALIEGGEDHRSSFGGAATTDAAR